MPSQREIDALESPIADAMLKEVQPTSLTRISDIVPDAPNDAVDLLSKMLVFNSKNRISAS